MHEGGESTHLAEGSVLPELPQEDSPDYENNQASERAESLDSSVPADAGGASDLVQAPTAADDQVADAGGSEGGEESIEDYMNRLLRRVRGQSGDSEEDVPSFQMPAPAPAIEPKPAVEEPTLGAGEHDQQDKPAAQPAADPSEPYVPRSHAPERDRNLAAMRELANTSARSAIATSARRRMANQAMLKFGAFGIGSLSGLIVLAATNFAFGRWMIVAGCCFALSGFFLFEALQIRRQLLHASGSSESSKEPSPATGDEESTPTVEQVATGGQPSESVTPTNAAADSGSGS